MTSAEDRHGKVHLQRACQRHPTRAGANSKQGDVCGETFADDLSPGTSLEDLGPWRTLDSGEVAGSQSARKRSSSAVCALFRAFFQCRRRTRDSATRRAELLSFRAVL